MKTLFHLSVIEMDPSHSCLSNISLYGSFTILRQKNNQKSMAMVKKVRAEVIFQWLWNFAHETRKANV